MIWWVQVWGLNHDFDSSEVQTVVYLTCASNMCSLLKDLYFAYLLYLWNEMGFWGFGVYYVINDVSLSSSLLLNQLFPSQISNLCFVYYPADSTDEFWFFHHQVLVDVLYVYEIFHVHVFFSEHFQ